MFQECLVNNIHSMSSEQATGYPKCGALLQNLIFNMLPSFETNISVYGQNHVLFIH